MTEDSDLSQGQGAYRQLLEDTDQVGMEGGRFFEDLVIDAALPHCGGNARCLDAGFARHDRERFLRTVQRHTERLNSLLEDLLVLSRLESTNPGLAFETVDFTHLVGEIVREFQSRPSASGRKLIFVPDERVGAAGAGVAPAFWGGARRREARARVCLSDAKRRELSETPPKLSTAGCPQRSEGTQRAGSPFLW